MGQCNVIANLGDGYYTAEIIKDEGNIDVLKEITEKAVSEAEGRVDDLSADLFLITNEIKVLVLAINTAIDTSSEPITDIERAFINKLTNELAELSNKAGLLKEQIALTDILIQSKNKSLESFSDGVSADIRNIWCADLSDELEGGLHGTLEVNRDNKTILIQPGGLAQSTKLQPTIASGPMTTAYNLAVLAAVQRDRPAYRVAVLSNLDKEKNTCTVVLNAAHSSQQNININKGLGYSGVEIDYMDCDAEAFEDGDNVIVQFQDGTPVVIGFVSNPAFCTVEAFMIENWIQGVSLPIRADENGFREDTYFEHEREYQWGNVDWTDGNRLITWNGPVSRYSDKFFKVSPIFEKGKIIKPEKQGWLTVGAGFRGEDLVVFYKGRDSFSDERNIKFQLYTPLSPGFDILCEITSPDGTVIFSGLVLIGVNQLTQGILISQDGQNARTIYVKYYEPFVGVLTEQVQSSADGVSTIDAIFSRNANEHVIEFSISSSSVSLIEDTLQFLYLSYGNLYLTNIGYIFPPNRPQEKIIAVDYKQNEKVEFVWSVSGTDTRANYPGGIANLMASLKYTYSFPWEEIITRTDTGQPATYGDGGTRHELDTTEIIMVLAMDMRYNTAIYVRHKFVDYHPIQIPRGEEYTTLSCTVSGSINITQNGRKNQLRSLDTFKWFTQSTPALRARKLVLFDYPETAGLLLFRLGFRDGLNGDYEVRQKSPEGTRDPYTQLDPYYRLPVPLRYFAVMAVGKQANCVFFLQNAQFDSFGEELAPDQELFLVNASGGFSAVTIRDDDTVLTQVHAKKKWLGIPNIGLM